MSEKTYKCKKCQTEFSDLKEYRSHVLKCQATSSESKDAKPKVEPKKVEQPKADKRSKEDAMRINTCRGEYEGNKEVICPKYNRCYECWGDY